MAISPFLSANDNKMLSPGRLLLEQLLPPGLESAASTLDKKGVEKLYRELASKYPDKYPEITKKLNLAAADVARREVAGGFSLDDLKPTSSALSAKRRIYARINDIVRSRLSEEEKQKKIVETLLAESAKLENEVYDEAIAKNNQLAVQVLSGARGNKLQLKRIIGGDIVYLNNQSEPIPFPAVNPYSVGVKPAEFWAAAYGARKALADTKLGIADSGYVLKLLNRAAHRLIVTAKDSLLKSDMPVGLPADVDDPDNVGALLAIDTGPYKANTVITPKILDDLRNKNFKQILVRSPITSRAPVGIYAADAGIREKGTLPSIGELPGMVAAQAIGERLAQTSFSSKHLGGVADRVSGFAAIERLINIPKNYGGAVHANVSGRVTKIYDTPQGEWVIEINGVSFRTLPKQKPIVSVGDTVEAGDIISEGLPNPAEVVRYKGIGEGRRAFVQFFVDAMRRANLPVNRRNVEFIARGLIDHVILDENYDDFLRGDIVPYSLIASRWKPREGAKVMPVDSAVGKYLELPVLHYTIGTHVTPRVVKTLKQFGVDKISVHNEPAPWTPYMIRAAALLEFDQNWLTRLLGSNQVRAILSAARRGADAPVVDSSYVPAKAVGMPLERWKELITQQY